jgi:ubiquinone/menaquinone biosynthesis C-methylase UbiE
MPNIILRTNATPVYGFLSFIHHRYSAEAPSQWKILDCGAGGQVPPLAIFARQGFECWGIDISDQQLDKAREYCVQHDLDIHLEKGDMRQMPFDDATFDFVYEQYAMCHMSKQDTAQSIREMHRVLKPGGLCLLGFISDECTPRSGFGVEQAPGEYYGKEGEEMTLHSLFSEQETDALVAGWEVLSKQKMISYRINEEGQYVHLFYTLQKP